MKMRKCPYCGRRISYASSFASRRKAEYICQKCGKESKVAVDKKVILFFIVAVVISLAIMAGWILTRCNSAHNFYGSFTELRSL